MEQFNKLIEFRQAVYDHGLTRAKDAQFELVDVFLLSPPIRSFPELSLSPVFRRQWPSVYAAVEEGSQDVAWLERYFAQHIPTTGVQVYPLDGTAWAHPEAKAMSDRQYVYSPTIAVDGGSIVVGHPYSVLAWAPERNSSWTPPVSVQRIESQQTAVQVGVEQAKRLCRYREATRSDALDIIAADGKYGNHHFLASLKVSRALCWCDFAVTECSMVHRVHIAAGDVLASTETDLRSKSRRRGANQRQPSN